MHILQANINANPNVGLFCYATNKYCLVPFGMSGKLRKKFEEVLNVPVHEMKVAGTDLLGVFLTGNDELLLVPKIIFDSELKLLNHLKIIYEVIDSELTALGNNFLISKNSCIINPEYSETVIKRLKKLGFDVKTGKIADLNIVGSMAVHNNKGCLISADAKDFEVKFLEKSLKIKVTKGTVNFGSPYVSSGIVCNSHGFVVGDMSGGPEIQNVDIALGFLEE